MRTNLLKDLLKDLLANVRDFIGGRSGTYENAKKKASFVMIDIERTNNNESNICQIGIAKIKNGIIESVSSTYVNPKQRFGSHHTKIQGIDEQKVRGESVFAHIAGYIRKTIESATIISHTRADEKSINAAFKRIGQKPVKTKWLDSVQIART